MTGGGGGGAAAGGAGGVIRTAAASGVYRAVGAFAAFRMARRRFSSSLIADQSHFRPALPQIGNGAVRRFSQVAERTPDRRSCSSSARSVSGGLSDISDDRSRIRRGGQRLFDDAAYVVAFPIPASAASGFGLVRRLPDIGVHIGRRGRQRRPEDADRKSAPGARFGAAATAPSPLVDRAAGRPVGDFNRFRRRVIRPGFGFQKTCRQLVVETSIGSAVASSSWSDSTS